MNDLAIIPAIIKKQKLRRLLATQLPSFLVEADLRLTPIRCDTGMRTSYPFDLLQGHVHLSHHLNEMVASFLR
jgi:hypothetical protein